MGTENSEVVIAVVRTDKAAQDIHHWIGTESLQNLFTFCQFDINDGETIILNPCGSKKYWEDDLIFGELRNRFIEFLESLKYEDDSSPVSWVEVGFGEFGQKILRGNNVNSYGDKEYEEDILLCPACEVESESPCAVKDEPNHFWCEDCRAITPKTHWKVKKL